MRTQAFHPFLGPGGIINERRALDFLLVGLIPKIGGGCFYCGLSVRSGPRCFARAACGKCGGRDLAYYRPFSLSYRVQLGDTVEERFQGSLGISFVPRSGNPVTVRVTAVPGTNVREFREGDLVLKR